MKELSHSGFVAILGRPNVGKSSLMNRMIGEKVAIVSDRPQTTRSKLMGILSMPDAQLVFVDTPGMHKPRTKLGEYMVKSIGSAKEGVDAVLVVVDAQHIGEGDRAVFEDALKMPCPKLLAVNKVDLTLPEALAKQLSSLAGYAFDQIFPVSAQTGLNVPELCRVLTEAMPKGPQYFPEDMMTDQPERVLCAEIVREKALRNLREEIPHGIGVEILRMQKVSEGLTEIDADLYCERASHKSIIIGKNGAMLRKIGQDARLDMERLLGGKVMLKLWVKVREDWRNRAEDLRTLGYED